jgi:tetratricopeptide (TPR) repeat protein
MSQKRFKVALSFPGEKRDFVEQVANELAAKLGKDKILYDNYLISELAQPDLDLYLGSLYREQSELLVPFFCVDYEKKLWCGLELRQIRDMMFNKEGSRIMPIRFDDTKIPGTLSIDGYVKIGNRAPREVAELILQRVEGKPQTPPERQNDPQIATSRRLFWIIGILAIVGLLVFGIYHSTQPKPFSPNITGVLVLRIAGDSDGSLQTQLLSSLHAVLANERINETIEIRSCDKSVDEGQGLEEAHKRARAIGGKFGAELVLWGNKAGDSKFFPRITVVSSRPIRCERTFSVQDIREVELPSQTLSQPLFLVHLLAGFSMITLDNGEFGLKHFEAARDLSESGSEDRAIVQLFMGWLRSVLAQKQGLGFPTVAIEELSSAADFFQHATSGANYVKYYVMAQFGLGLSYGALGKGRDLDRSITAYQTALTACNETNHPYFWASVQYGLGQDYCELKTDGGYKNAITAFQNGLRVFKKDTDPAEWANVENGLGYAYAKLPIGDLNDNLDRAIAYCRSSLTVANETDFPLQWSDAQANLGGIYLKLMSGDKGENINRSMLCSQAALRVQTKTDWPLGWANIQIHLAEAYFNLPIGDRLTNINHAIAASELALTVYSETNFPEDWAAAQANLAVAYLSLPNDTGATNALIAATKALEVVVEKTQPVQWARIQWSLAHAYGQISEITTSNRVENCKSLIAAFQAGSRVFTEQEYPEEWAEAQEYSGITYGMIGEYAKANESLTTALRVINERTSPSEWAKIQYGLGISYVAMPSGDRLSNLLQSKICFSNALRISSFGNSQNRERASKAMAIIKSEIKVLQEPK